MRTIGEKIRSLRESNGLTQEQLSKKVEVAPVTISKWELDISKPKAKSTIKLGNIFNVSAEAFISHKSEIEIIDKLISVPFYPNVKAAAGCGCLTMEENYELIQIPDRLIDSQDDVIAVTISGDSMEPVFGDNTIVFIDPTKNIVSDGKVYVFIHDDMVRMKILEELPYGFRIKSYNVNYPPEDIDTDKERFHIVGKVVAQMQKYS